MFIFISLDDREGKWIKDIYIPLCLYLYEGYQAGRITCWTIYIPLCLYLYAGSIHKKNQLKNLHSTMFIFIWRSKTLMLTRSLIYIPLCLYLYGVRFPGLLYPDKIYIPLCLYLYQNSYFFYQKETYLHSTMFIFILPSV